jgi:hypothetical protein
MNFCLRVDLDYVPWDTEAAEEYGHSEPAIFMRLLELAKVHGYKFHFFASTRVLRAFPATAEAVLNEGHDLDWLISPNQELDSSLGFQEIGHTPMGAAINTTEQLMIALPEIEIKFLCHDSKQGHLGTGIKEFHVKAAPLEDATKGAEGYKQWLKNLVQEQTETVIMPIRPQILGKIDPKLKQLEAVLLKMPVPKTLRELVDF